MKAHIPIPVVLSVLLMASFLISQNQPGLFPDPAEMEKSRSIHEFEWNRYRNYIPEKEIPPFRGQPMPLLPRETPPSREIFGYLPYWVYNGYPALNYSLLTTIAYFGVEVDGQGNIVDQHQWPAAGLINLAHSQGVRVVLTVILFDPTQLTTLLSSPSNRLNLINNLLVLVQLADGDGVSIDFERVPAGNKQNLTDFMTELTDAFHTAIPGSFVTIFTPAVDWSSVYDYYALAQVTDGLIIQGYDYHWGSGPTAGPVAPLTSGNVWGYWNVSRSVDDYLLKTQSNTAKLILSVPFYGIEWPTVDDQFESPTTGNGTSYFYSSMYARAMQYGPLWDQNSLTPWYNYNDGQWHQGWYDDSLSLSLKFALINSLDLKGTAIWALSYDGQRQELQAALSNAFGSTAPPLKPTHFRITNVGGGNVQVAVNSVYGATSYRLYTSMDGTTFDPGVDFPAAVMNLSNLVLDSIYYFKVSAINGNGESNPTEVLAVLPTEGQANILVVNGFDRTSGTVNSFDFIKRFAPSIVKTGRAFNSCANEAVEDNQVSLLGYDAVIWISGEEGTADESFSATEQLRLAEYLENGGQLFISGSEIGYDLVEKGTAADQQFYRDYFKAQYVQDKVPSYTLSPTSSGIFSGLADMNFDNGNFGTYNVDFPDGINPIDGSQRSMTYPGFDPNATGGAGIQYEGIFGQGTAPGKLVYLAVPFETIYPEGSRDSLMERVLNFFDIPTAIAYGGGPVAAPGKFELLQNYPNPFNPSTTITFTLNFGAPVQVRLTIFNLLGQEVATLLNDRMPPGTHRVFWDGRNNAGVAVSSGVYIYRLQVEKQVQSRRMTLLR